MTTQKNKEANQFSLLTQRRFAPFFWAQASSALNDHLFKNALIILAAFYTAEYAGISLSFIANLTALVFVLPFLIFSAMAGQLADKVDRTRLFQLLKAVELAIALIAATGLFTKYLPLLLLSIALSGVHSAFFSPVKYAILPSVLEREEIVGGNGLIITAAFSAILIGTTGAAILIGHFDGGRSAAIVMVIIAATGLGAALLMPLLSPKDPGLKVDLNPLRETISNIAYARRKKPVFLSLLGISWFWFYAAFLLSQFAPYAEHILGGNPQITVALLVMFSGGVVAGALACEALGDRKVEIGLVPVGAIGLTIFASDLWMASPSFVAAHLTVMLMLSKWTYLRIFLDIAFIGMFAGIYVVPLYALLQSRTDSSRQGRIVASSNILNVLFSLVAGGVSSLLFSLGLGIPEMFLACAIFNAIIGFYIYTLVPEFYWRFMAWILVNVVYRVERAGLSNIPQEGPCLLVCNHVSFADAPVLTAMIRRPIRFVMDYNIFKVPALSFLCRGMKVIPILPRHEDPEILARAYAEVEKALKNGDIVGIFPEGSLTRDGEMHTFKKGIEHILRKTPVPVVPMALSGLWDSALSRNRASRWRRFWSAWPARRVTLNVGEMVSPEIATAEYLQQCVESLRLPHLK